MLESKEKVTKIILGIDVGQQQDYTAITGIEIKQRYSPILTPANTLNTQYGNYKADGEPFHLIRMLERYPLKTSYPEQVKRVIKLYHDIESYQGIKPIVVVDATGCGRPIYDLFVDANLKPKGVLIHGGATVTRDKQMYHIPKRDLVACLQVLLQNQRLKISSHLPERKTLYNELLNFKVKIDDKTGHDSYSAWREKDHDDLVLSTACGCWFGEKLLGNKVRSINKSALGIR